MDAQALPRPLILLVEDDARSARVLAQMLRNDGFDVEVALNGAAAIARLSQAGLPDVLVTDLALPHADGVAIAKYARSLDAALPVVVVTGYPQLLEERGEEISPAPRVFVKPVDYDALCELLQGIKHRLHADT